VLVIKKKPLGQDGQLEGNLTIFRKELCRFLRRMDRKVVTSGPYGPQFLLRNGAKSQLSGASPASPLLAPSHALRSPPHSRISSYRAVATRRQGYTFPATIFQGNDQKVNPCLASSQPVPPRHNQSCHLKIPEQSSQLEDLFTLHISNNHDLLQQLVLR
jgi:hypothetical protein